MNENETNEDLDLDEEETEASEDPGCITDEADEPQEEEISWEDMLKIKPPVVLTYFSHSHHQRRYVKGIGKMGPVFTYAKEEARIFTNQEILMLVYLVCHSRGYYKMQPKSPEELAAHVGS